MVNWGNKARGARGSQQSPGKERSQQGQPAGTGARGQPTGIRVCQQRWPGGRWGGSKKSQQGLGKEQSQLGTESQHQRPAETGLQGQPERTASGHWGRRAANLSTPLLLLYKNKGFYFFISQDSCHELIIQKPAWSRHRVLPLPGRLSVQRVCDHHLCVGSDFLPGEAPRHQTPPSTLLGLIRRSARVQETAGLVRPRAADGAAAFGLTAKYKEQIPNLLHHRPRVLLVQINSPSPERGKLDNNRFTSLVTPSYMLDLPSP